MAHPHADIMAKSSPTADSIMSQTPSGLVSPRLVKSRTQSISSDRPSTIGHSLGLLSPTLSVSPEPAFIAAKAASQIVTIYHKSHAGAWYDQSGIDPSPEAALLSPVALQLVNSFLDQLLFNFLHVSKAATLPALRPAVSEILKPKLAKDTITNADEELREYLGGSHEDDSPHPDDFNAADWDAEYIWKRTRLRCMVYSSLGDMEEEDEDLYIQRENLIPGSGGEILDVVPPAVAIFLTSVLEYIGELTLTVAGKAAYHRIRAKMEKEIKDGSRNSSVFADRIIVGEMDMERVALDRTLGRLWRGWKKRIRCPGLDFSSRPFSRGSTTNSIPHQTAPEEVASKAATSDDGSEWKKSPVRGRKALSKSMLPASSIPLPLGDNDVEEIEVPGLAHYSDDEADQEGAAPCLRRSSSLPIRLPNYPRTPSAQPSASLLARRRSRSLPTPIVIAPLDVFYPARKFPSVAKPRAGVVPPRKPVPAPAPGSVRASPLAAVVDRDNKTAAASRSSPAFSPSHNRHYPNHATATSTMPSSANVEDDDGNEVATYETAEVVSSSRVSFSRSSTSSASNHAKPASVKRPLSVHSARIIDVSDSRSPTHSRSTSSHEMDHPRSVAASSPPQSRLASSSSVEERLTSKMLAHGPGSQTHPVATPRSSPDAKKLRRRPAGLTPDSEKIAADRHPAGATVPATETMASPGGSVIGTARPRAVPADQTSNASPKRSQAPRMEPTTPITKVTVIKHLSSSTGPFMEDTIPEIPVKAAGHSGWHSPKNDPRSPTFMEQRPKAREAEEDATLPMQSNVVTRQTHTSASSASSGNSRIKLVRTSEESSSRAETVARNFEELIQSNQTITYTLTPENMRDIDAKSPPDGPVVTRSSRKGEEGRGQVNSQRSSPTLPEASKSPPSYRSIGPDGPLGAERRPGKSSGSIPRAKIGLAVSTGPTGWPQARDARIARDSSADLAEFLKSTAPPGDKVPVAARQLGSPTSSMNSGPVPRRVSVKGHRGRYQPRDAVVDSRGDNSDLIDFLRQGPPTEAGISRLRHGAASRKMADSEPSWVATGSLKNGDSTVSETRYSQASTNMTDNSMPSVHSSINSNSALLKHKGATTAGSTLDEEIHIPERKHRRILDPYAVDMSDEDEVERTVTPKRKGKKEESLAEFLRDCEPPAADVTSSPMSRLPRKKASAPSLINRLTRGSAKDDRDLNATGFEPTRESEAVATRGPSMGRIGGKGGGGYIPIQVNMPLGYHGPGFLGDDAQSEKVVTGSMASPGPRVAMRKYEPREATAARSQTSDLSAFLRDSAPPDNAVGGTTSSVLARPDEGRSRGKLFGRRRKAGLV